MHYVLLRQISQSIYLKEQQDHISFIFDAHKNLSKFDEQTARLYAAEFVDWTDWIYTFEFQAMTITYLMYMSWMFTFQHIFEAVYAAKNKRQAKFVLIENIVDFWIMIMGMIYIAIVYKVYRWNTFVNMPPKEEMAQIFFKNWKKSTDVIPDQIFLLIIDVTYISKAYLQGRLLPYIGPILAIGKKLVTQLLIFTLFYFLVQFIFSVVGNLLFYDLKSFKTISESMLTIFKSSAGIFNNEEVLRAQEG